MLWEQARPVPRVGLHVAAALAWNYTNPVIWAHGFHRPLALREKAGPRISASYPQDPDSFCWFAIAANATVAQIKAEQVGVGVARLW